jgi:hypothetical protein
MDIWMRFTLAALAVWRITNLLANEDGPWDLVVRLRRAAGNSFLGGLMDCFLCLSLWVAAPFTFFVTDDVSQWVVSWLALSAMACLLDRLGKGGIEHGLLRPEESGSDANDTATSIASRHTTNIW